MAGATLIEPISGTWVFVDGQRANVRSERLRLPLTAGTNGMPGTAVRLGDDLWEVVEAHEERTGGSWMLVPWERTEIVRRVFTLDASSCTALIGRRREERASVQRRWLMTMMMPVLGLAPGPWQERWSHQWGYPAMAAVAMTSILEMIVGAAGSLQLAAGSFGIRIVPSILMPFIVLGPFVFVEGAIRLVLSNAHGEPVGSAAGSILLVPAAFRKHRGGSSTGFSAVALLTGMTLKTVAALFGSRRTQIAWARRIDVPPIVLTLVSAVFECLGGWRDLAHAGHTAAWLTIVSLVIFADGSIRLVLAGLTRGPVASVFGWPFARFLERLLG